MFKMMNRLKIASITLSVFLSLNINAQIEPKVSAPNSPESVEVIDLAQYLPPLSILIDTAIANSPAVKQIENQIMMQEYNVRIVRKDWTEMISASGGAYYSSNSQSTISEDFGLLPESQALTYRVGGGVNVPLDFFATRGDRIAIEKLQVENLKMQREIIKDAVAKQVLETYNLLLLSQRLLSISTAEKEAAVIIYEMSEKKFRDGELTLDQLAANTGFKAKSATSYEKQRTQFSDAYNRLERLVGVPLSKIEY